MKKILVLLLIVILLSVSNLAGFAFHVERVMAAGTSTLTINASAYRYYWTGYGSWTTEVHIDTASSNLGGLNFDYDAGDTPNYWRIESTDLKFDLSSYLALPAGSQVISAYLHMYCNGKNEYNSPICAIPYFSIYDTWLGIDHVWNSTDVDAFIDEMPLNRLSAVYGWNALTVGSYIDMTFPAGNLSTLLAPKSGEGNYKYLRLASHWHAIDYDPGTGGKWKYLAGYNATFDVASHLPQLIITYAASATPPTMTYHTNGPVNPAPIGTENVTAIVLSTPSCMYANEPLEFDVQGESGANCTLELRDNKGLVLDSKNDSVRQDGHYWWKIISLPANYSGFVSVYEKIFNLQSPWVCVQPSYDSTESNLMIYAASTVYPQYTLPFSTYVVQRGSIMYVHWKTNINMATDNTSDLVLKILMNGDAIDGIKYTETFDYLNTSYFQGYSCNTSTHWRFAVFTPQLTSGQNSYGGLIQDLGVDPGSYNKGFLESMIYNGGSEIVTCHSAYWYLDSPADGLSSKLVSSSVAVNSPIGLTVTEPAVCRAKTYLPNVYVQIIDAGVSTTGTFSASSPDSQTLSISGIGTEGTYTIRTAFSGGGCTYQYVTESMLQISTSGAVKPPILPGDTITTTDLLDWLNDVLNSHGLNSTLGHWLILLILMVIMIVIGWKSKSKIMIVVLPLMILGIGIIIKWVDPWVIVLLALSAGVTIFSMIRGRIAGRGGGGSEG